MTYEEFIEMLNNSGVDGVEQYTNAARDTYDGITAGANARIAELESQNADLAKQLQETQARNYVLMTAATTKVDEPEETVSEPDDEDKDVTSLFAE